MKAFTLGEVITTLVMVGVLTWLGLQRVAIFKETERARVIVNEVKHLIGECKHIGDAVISIRGKYLIWDMSKNFHHDAHHKLPVEIKANSSDSPITVFMVLAERNVMVGRYSTSNEPAYRQYMDVCVAYWPDKKAVGMHSVVSKEPRSSRPVQHRPEYGDPSEPIAKWISSLPRRK